MSRRSDESFDRSFAPGIVPTKRPGKTGGVRMRNRKLRTAALCEAALQLFLEHGIEPTTVDEITRQADVAKGTFYRYFEDKEQLVEALFAPLAKTVFESMERCREALSCASDVDELERAYSIMAAEFGALLFETADMVQLYLQECRGASDGAHAPIVRLADELTQGAIGLTRVAASRELLRDLPAEVIGVAVVGAIEGMLVRHFSGHPDVPILEATAGLITMVLHGIRKPS